MVSLGEKTVFLLGLAATILVLSVPLLLRLEYYSGLPMGEEPYYYLSNDGLYSLVTSFLGPFSMVVPVALGAFSYILFFTLLKQLNLRAEVRYISIFMLILTPAFIYTFTFFNPHALSVAVTLAAMTLALSKSRFSKFAATVPICIAVALSFFNALLILFLLAACFFAVKKDRSILFYLFIAFTGTLLLYIQRAAEVQLAFHNIVSGSIAALGTVVGFSAFALLLGAIGFLSDWRKKSFAYATVFYVVLAQLFFGAVANQYTSFLLAVMAAQGFFWLARREWDLTVVRHLTVSLLGLGIFFSAVSYISSIGTMEPNQEMAESLGWLGAQEKGVVLSHQSNGFWISYFAGMPAFVDGFSSTQKVDLANEIFSSRTIEKTKSLLYQNNVKYIWIDPKMPSGEVWSKDSEGLLFLFRDNKTFKSLYDHNNIRILEVLRQDG